MNKELLIFIIENANLKKYKKPIFWILFILFIFQILSLATPYITGLIIDNFIAGINLYFVLPLIGLVFVAEIISNSLYALKEKIDSKSFYFDFGRDLKNTGWKKLLSFSTGQHISQSSGVKDMVVSKGTNQIKELSRNIVYSFLPVGLTTLVTFSALLFLDVQIALVCIVFFALLLWYQTILLKKTHPKMIEGERFGQNVNKVTWNILHNILLVKNNGREDFAQETIDQEIKKDVDFNKNFWSFYTVKLIGSGKFIVVGTTVVMILSAFKISSGVLSPGMFVVVSMWSSMFFSNALRFQGIYRVVAGSLPAIQEYKDFYEMNSSIVDEPKALTPDSFQGGVEFKNVSFSYPDEEGEKFSALKKVSFKIEPRETVGVVGKSGSGKTTLTKLLLRNYDPSKGSIVIDGHNLKKLKLSHYLEHVGYVEQSTQLLDMTIKENLAFVTSRPLTKEDFEKALTQAGLLDFIQKLPNGLDTKIGEQGIKLSGGQRQRLAIARALIKKPALLILDEATASLDTEKEREIQEAIDNLAKENISATKIVIAHRLSTIVNADRIFVFNEGKIIAIGTHQELLETCELYQNLYNLQHQTALI